MIKSFKDQDTERIYRRLYSRGFPPDIQRTALRKLRMLNNARSLQDLRSPPGNRLEKLFANRRGQHSIRVNDQWRICFVWRESAAFEVEITDYH
ncbi:MAG: type II toxin-antitoxin system RelE/ParE family toxin [Chloroflexi bacterium]|nr:type II toxin-antitoxin system RelE/ParE family toxin [Chloroflexota bacterium]